MFVNYNKISVNDLSFDNKSRNILHKGIPLIVSGSRMELKGLDKIDSTNYNLNLRFKVDIFCKVVSDIDNVFITKLYNKYKNIENNFIPSIRVSSFDNNKDYIYLRCTCSNNVEFYDQDKSLLSDDKLSSIISTTYNSASNSTFLEDNNIEVIPLFKLSLKTAGNFKYIDWELLQLKVFLENEQLDYVPSGSCVIDDEDIL